MKRARALIPAMILLVLGVAVLAVSDLHVGIGIAGIVAGLAVVGLTRPWRPTDASASPSALERAAYADDAARQAAVAAEANGRLDLLARATESVATATEVPVALARIADLLVPELADVASVYLAEQDAVQAGLTSADSGAVTAFALLRRTSIVMAPGLPAPSQDPQDNETGGSQLPGLEVRTADHPLMQALMTGEPQLQHLDEANIPLWATQPDGQRWLEEIGAHSIFVVPLSVPSAETMPVETIGLLVLLRCGNRQTPHERDLAFVASVVARTSEPLARARAYERERATAVALQRELLPRDPPCIPGLTVAARYTTGTAGLAIGGDWWDVFDLGTGRIGVVIGDVMGRGLRAAAIMGQLRSAIRAWARVDLPVVDTLVLLDGLVSELAGGGADAPLVTACYGTLDLTTGDLEIANAGHLPPLVVRADGRTELLEGDVGTLLGLGLGDIPVRRTRLDVNDTLALFTDGLVETHRRDFTVGTDRLAGRLADLLMCERGGTPDLDHAADTVLGEMLDPGDRDDAALVLLTRTRTDHPPQVLRLVLDSDPDALSRLRSAIRGFLDVSSTSAIGDDVLVIATELTTNALCHGSGQPTVTITQLADRLVIDVHDQAARLPRRRYARPSDEGGRGLHLVGALASRWGSRLDDDGKSVWAEIAINPWRQ